VRTPHILKIRSIQAPFQDLPICEWELACKCNGICPEDAAIVEWQSSLQPENYEAVPPYTPDPSLDLVSEDGLILTGTDGRTHLRRLRHSVIGICGGGSSSWNSSSPLFGPVQMKHKAELVATDRTVEAVGDKEQAFLEGVEVFIDNKAACNRVSLFVRPLPTSSGTGGWEKLSRAFMT
jgi:hypothetical protein